jgi:RNA 2',3'-cyclic 3'-phosphodiesterase
MSGNERLFFGVATPAAVRDELERRLAGFPMATQPLRLAPPANWHITLRFLGATSIEKKKAMGDLVNPRALPPAFGARLTGWGAFPRASRGSVLWVGIEDQGDNLTVIANHLENAAREAGFPPEQRPFKPHLTLGRSREPTDLRGVLAALPPVDLPFAIREFTLFRSILGGAAPRYEIVEVYPLP